LLPATEVINTFAINLSTWWLWRNVFHNGFNFVSPLAWWIVAKNKNQQCFYPILKQHLIMTKNELKHHEWKPKQKKT
jgi:hypothetical protein